VHSSRLRISFSILVLNANIGSALHAGTRRAATASLMDWTALKHTRGLLFLFHSFRRMMTLDFGTWLTLDCGTRRTAATGFVGSTALE